MKIQLIVSVLCALLLCGTAFAVEEEVFNGVIKFGQEADAKGVKFTATSWGEPPSKVLVKFLGNTVVVKLKDCEIKDKIKVCFDSYAEGDYNYELDKYTYDIQMKIYQTKSDIIIKRTISDDKLDLGESATIKAVLENPELIDATKAEYEDVLPEEVSVNMADGPCTVQGKKVSWKGNVLAKEKVQCSYTVKIESPLEHSSKASLKFFNGLSETTKESDAIHFKVDNEFIEIKINSSAESAELNDFVNIFIHLRDITGKGIGVDNFMIELPEQFAAVTRGELDKELMWSGELKGNLTLKMGLRASRSGTGKIKATAHFTYNKVPLSIIQTKQIEVKKPAVRVNSSLQKYKYGAGEPFPLSLQLHNPTKYDFKNLKAKLSTNIKGFRDIEMEAKKFGSQEKISIYNGNVTMPLVNQTFDGEIKLEYSYETAAGERISEAHSEYVFAIPLSQPAKEETKAEDKAKEAEKEADAEKVEGELENTVSFDFNKIIIYVLTGIIFVLAVVIFLVGRLLYKLR